MAIGTSPTASILNLKRRYATVAAMAADSPNIADGELCETIAYTTVGDDGGNTYRFKTTGRTGETVDDVLVFAGVGSDDFFKAVNTGSITTAQAGLSTSNTAADNQTQLDAAIAAVPLILVSPFTHNVNHLGLQSNRTIRGIDRALSVIQKDHDGAAVPDGVTAAVVFNGDWQNDAIDNVTVENLTIDGNRANLDTTAQTGDGAMHGIAPWGIQGLRVDGVTVKNCWTDGLYWHGTHSTATTQANTLNTTVRDVLIENCGRQGVSIISGEDLSFRSLRIDDINRTSPRAAIDLEPNPGQSHTLRRVNIDGVLATGVKQGIVASDVAYGEVTATINNFHIRGDGTETLSSLVAQQGAYLLCSNVTVENRGASSGQVFFTNHATARLRVNGFRVTNCHTGVRANLGKVWLANGEFEDMNTAVFQCDAGATLHVDNVTVNGANLVTSTNVWTQTGGTAFANRLTLNDCQGLGIRVDTAAEAYFSQLVMTEVDATTMNLRDTATVRFDGVRLHNIETDNAAAAPITVTSPNVSFRDLRITGSNLTGVLFDFAGSGVIHCDNAEIHITYGSVASQTEADANQIIGFNNSWQRKIRATTGAAEIHWHQWVRVDSGSIKLDEHANWEGNEVYIANATGAQITVTVVAAPATITGTATIEDDKVGVFKSDGTTFFRVNRD